MENELIMHASKGPVAKRFWIGRIRYPLFAYYSFLDPGDLSNWSQLDVFKLDKRHP